MSRKVFGCICGPSGIGKGYGVGEVVHEYFGARIFVTGEWCRDHAKDHACNGSLAPDQPLLTAIREDYDFHRSERYLIDAPRSVGQMKLMMDMFMEWDSAALIVSLHITADRHLCEGRIRHRAINQHRNDDAKPEVIKKRLDVYFGNPESGTPGISTELIPYLREFTKYEQIDGNQSLEIIRHQVREVHGPALFDLSEES